MSNEMIWITAGCVMMFAELLIPGFIIFFFGAGAILTAGIQLLFPLTFAGQILVFLSSSLLLLLLMRRFMPKIFAGTKKDPAPLPPEEEEFAGESATVIEEITPEHSGKILFHGSTWSAESERICKAGENVRIINRKNLTFNVK